MRKYTLLNIAGALRMVCLLSALTISTGLMAQGWQRYYTGDRLFSMALLPDGSLVAAGGARDSSGISGGYWLQADILGAPLAEFRTADISGNNIYLSAVLPIAGGGWLLPAANNNGDSIYLATMTASGNITPAYWIGSGLLYGNAVTPENNWLYCGAQKTGNGGNNFNQALWGMADLNGQVIWEHLNLFGLSDETVDVEISPDGSKYWFLGRSLDTIGGANYHPFIIKTDQQGHLLLFNKWVLNADEKPEKIIYSSDHQLIMAGSAIDPDSPMVLEEDPWIAAADTAGNLLWSKAIPLPGLQQIHAIAATPNGDWVLAGETRPGQNGSRDALLLRTDPVGNLIWHKTYGGLKGDIFWDLAVLPDGNIALAGQSASFGNGDLRAWLLRTDEAGNLWTNRINGTVAIDYTQDCAIGAIEQRLANWLVRASGAPGHYYTLTDSLGNYSVAVDSGAWYLSALPPSTYWQPCFDSVSVEILNTNDTAWVDFPVQAVYNCPALQVDISTPFLRRCFENTFTVRWQNNGSAPANQTRIAVVPDPYLLPVNSSIPYQQQGDTLWFEVGETLPMQGGSFWWSAILDCDNTVLGQSHCTSVWISPDSLCTTIDPDWDGSSLQIEGYCAGDSVVLTITNIGLGNMQQAVEYVITEDQVIFKRAPLLLAAGADTAIVLYPNGATVTLQVQQSPGHPGMSQPTLVIEGCGQGVFSTGYAFQFPTDDSDPFTDIECRQNIGSFDPNDKIGLPEGVGTTKTIEVGDAIEYLIRFQNTGTDTAFRVEIRDTLPVELDLSTLELGASSNPYAIEIGGKGILRFIFSPIALPDSATNPTTSLGFVKYRIRTHNNLLAGTTIENRAAIYFDFNAPVLTEKTQHTIGEPLNELLTISTKTMVDDSRMTPIEATPNPFNQSTLLSWPLLPGRGIYSVRVTDITGQLSARYETITNAFILPAENLPEGVFFLQIFDASGLAAVGKIIKVQ